MSTRKSIKEHDSRKLWRSLDEILCKYRKKNNLARLEPNRYYLGVARLLAQLPGSENGVISTDDWMTAKILYDAFLTSKFNKSINSSTLEDWQFEETWQIDAFLSSQYEDSND